MEDIAIKVANLNKTFNNQKAVNNLSFNVNKNECFGLLGPNGAGKTTTMKILYGKSLPDKQSDSLINVFGYSSPKDSLYIKALSGIVPQQDNLDIQLSVKDNLIIYSKFYGIPYKDATKKIDELLDFMELSEKANSNVRELSGGMQRRLTIARALLNNPSILFLDEPTTGLDPQVRHLIWNKLRELKEKGVTLILTTHYMEEASQICDSILIMDKGNSILYGNPRKLIEDNLEKYVVEIYGMCKENNSCENYFKTNNIRYEYFNDIFMAYSNQIEKLRAFGETTNISDYQLRSSNLEDLFLKVTGRKLNELQ